MNPTNLNNYRGHKGIEGLYQWIINRIPAHKFYYEPFAGSAQIARRLPGKSIKVVMDCNSGVTVLLKKELPQSITVRTENALKWITSVPADTDTFIYLDPPYLIDESGLQKGTIRKKIYECSLTHAEHRQLLSSLVKVKCKCMISSYKNDLYDRMLKNWNCEEKKVRYKNKTVNECVYYNYPKPSVLQTYAHIGNDCWDRQRITRKINRLSQKLLLLPEVERNAVIDRVTDIINTKTTVRPGGTVKTNINGHGRQK